jgi:polyphosphate kinase
MSEFKLFNRDISWLKFNERVLLEAKDSSVPLYNRISFLSIFSSNLDEFFRVRMPSILALHELNIENAVVDEQYPIELVTEVQAILQNQLDDYGKILRQQILPALNANNIHLVYGSQIEEEQLPALREYFHYRIMSFLQPVWLNHTNRKSVFPENNALYFIVSVSAKNDAGRIEYVLLNIPSNNLPRFFEPAKAGEKHYIIFLDDIIREHLFEIFPGYIINECYSIKVTRDAELNVGDEFTGDIAEKIEESLGKRDLGSPTRFLYEYSMPLIIRKFLQHYFKLSVQEMVEGGRYHNLKDLASLPDPTKGKLSYSPWASMPHIGINNNESLLSQIDDSDKLMHIPYHSYNNILRFFNEAAVDPFVKEIYITLYRVASESQIVHALISAARNGKRVTVFVELKARFDEANNLKWSKKMKAAGVKIVYSIPALKVHAKIALIKRKQGWQYNYYALLATGNFNESTARFYTDHALFTADKNITAELELLFCYLRTREKPEAYHFIQFKDLLVSQFNIIERFEALIEREIEHAKNGRPAHIIIKLNNLQEKKIIYKLYAASIAGVKIELIIRGICCLIPGVAGMSENITVRRIVDRYLEHGRVFIFHNNGNREYYMGSADWMNRNLHSRIEVCFPIKEPALQKQLEDIIQLQLADNCKAVMLNKNLENVFIERKEGEGQLRSQESIYKYVKELCT